MFPLVCEILFHLCILGTYFHDRSEIMLSCLSPESRNTRLESTSVLFAWRRRGGHWVRFWSGFAWLRMPDMRDCARSSAPAQSAAGTRFRRGFDPSSSAPSFLLVGEECRFSEETMEKVVELGFVWLVIFTLLLYSSTGTTPHAAAGVLPVEFFFDVCFYDLAKFPQNKTKTSGEKKKKGTC